MRGRSNFRDENSRLDELGASFREPDQTGKENGQVNLSALMRNSSTLQDKKASDRRIRC